MSLERAPPDPGRCGRRKNRFQSPSRVVSITAIRDGVCVSDTVCNWQIDAVAAPAPSRPEPGRCGRRPSARGDPHRAVLPWPAARRADALDRPRGEPHPRARGADEARGRGPGRAAPAPRRPGRRALAREHRRDLEHARAARGVRGAARDRAVDAAVRARAHAPGRPDGRGRPSRRHRRGARARPSLPRAAVAAGRPLDPDRGRHAHARAHQRASCAPRSRRSRPTSLLHTP